MGPTTKVILAYDELATAATAIGLIDTTRKTRPAVFKAAKLRQEKVLNMTHEDFPLTCPSRGELESFLNVSIQLEAKIVPEFHASPEGKQVHQETFWKNVARKKYCSVDSKAVLADPSWAKFFLDFSGLTEPLATE